MEKLFSWKKPDDIFQKNQKVTFFEEVNFRRKSLFRKKWLFENFRFLKNIIDFVFKKNVFFSWFFKVFLFLWYLIPKLSNVELLTPQHTLLVAVYVSGIFSKIRKIKKILKTVPAVERYPWFSTIKKNIAIFLFSIFIYFRYFPLKKVSTF